VIAAGCGDISGSFGASDAVLRGTVTYRERIAPTEGATLKVQIRDTSLADAASELIAEQVVSAPGQVPIRFEVFYNRSDINPRNTYSVSARIEEADGRLAFINDTAYDVITGGNPTRVDMVLVMVEPPPEMVDGEWSREDSLPVEAPVTVTATDILWEGSDAYVQVVFVVSEQDGCYRIGREEAIVDGTEIWVEVTAWAPAPTPWAIDCSERNLELSAVMHIGTPLVNGAAYTVNVNGQPAMSFTAP
jgi:uncharacterized lipoprotein YbaY